MRQKHNKYINGFRAVLGVIALCGAIYSFVCGLNAAGYTFLAIVLMSFSTIVLSRRFRRRNR